MTPLTMARPRDILSGQTISRASKPRDKGIFSSLVFSEAIRSDPSQKRALRKRKQDPPEEANAFHEFKSTVRKEQLN